MDPEAGLNIGISLYMYMNDHGRIKTKFSLCSINNFCYLRKKKKKHEMSESPLCLNSLLDHLPEVIVSSICFMTSDVHTHFMWSCQLPLENVGEQVGGSCFHWLGQPNDVLMVL